MDNIFENNVFDQHDFVENLIELRKVRGLSQEKLSFGVGRHGRYINQIENFQKTVSLEGFFRICMYLNVPPNSLVPNFHIEHNESMNYILDLLKRLDQDDIEFVKKILDAFVERKRIEPKKEDVL